MAIDELNSLSKDKSEANSNHYLYDFDKVRTLNNRILSKEKSKRNNLILVLCLLVLSSIVMAYIFYRKRKKTISALEGLEKNTSTPKKEYSISKSLEEDVLTRLQEFENSSLFLDEKLNIQRLAKNFGTNSSYLSSIINEKKGKTFKQYIGELRINYLIKTLQSDTKLRSYTIQALAQEIGYTNASSFSRAFKNQMGITPSEFIKKLSQ